MREGELTIEDLANNSSYKMSAIELDMRVELAGDQLQVPQASLSVVAQGSVPLSITARDASFNKASGAARLPECKVMIPAGLIELTGTTTSLTAGSLSLSAESLDVAKLMQVAAAFAPAAANIKLTGQLALRLDHDIEKGRTNLKTATLRGFGGSISAPSTATLGTPIKAASRIDAANLSVAELTKAFAPHLTGVLDGTITRVKWNLPDIALNDPANTATGNGSLAISNGIIKGLNIPAQALAKIDSLPFLAGNLRQRVPPEFESLVTKPDTTINEISSDFSIAKGVLQLSVFNLVSDYFSLRGGGTYSIAGEVNMTANLMLRPEISSGITKKAKELQALVDAQNQLVLPLTINGKVPALIVTPDLNAILKKASTAGIAQALDKVLKDKKVGGKLGKILGF